MVRVFLEEPGQESWMITIREKIEKLYGANFAEQFEYALEVDPEFHFHYRME